MSDVRQAVLLRLSFAQTCQHDSDLPRVSLPALSSAAGVQALARRTVRGARPLHLPVRHPAVAWRRLESCAWRQGCRHSSRQQGSGACKRAGRSSARRHPRAHAGGKASGHEGQLAWHGLHAWRQLALSHGMAWQGVTRTAWLAIAMHGAEGTVLMA